MSAVFLTVERLQAFLAAGGSASNRWENIFHTRTRGAHAGSYLVPGEDGTMGRKGIRVRPLAVTAQPATTTIDHGTAVGGDTTGTPTVPAGTIYFESSRLLLPSQRARPSHVVVVDATINSGTAAAAVSPPVFVSISDGSAGTSSGVTIVGGGSVCNVRCFDFPAAPPASHGDTRLERLLRWGHCSMYVDPCVTPSTTF